MIQRVIKRLPECLIKAAILILDFLQRPVKTHRSCFKINSYGFFPNHGNWNSGCHLGGGEPAEITRSSPRDKFIRTETISDRRLEKGHIRGFFNGRFRLLEEAGTPSRRSAPLALSVSAAGAEKRGMRIRLSGLLIYRRRNFGL